MRERVGDQLGDHQHGVLASLRVEHAGVVPDQPSCDPIESGERGKVVLRALTLIPVEGQASVQGQQLDQPAHAR